MKSSLFFGLITGALTLLVSLQFSSPQPYLPCKRHTSCMCETDDFTIDISNAFDYPFNVSFYVGFENKYYYMSFDCHGMICNNYPGDPDGEGVAMCQYIPELGVNVSCGKSRDYTWLGSSRDEFRLLYNHGSALYNKHRSSCIDFNVSANPSEASRLSFEYEYVNDISLDHITFVFHATIPKYHIHPTPDTTPTPAPPRPAPPSPHCYNNDQLVMNIGVSSTVAIAVFALMVATIGAVVIWVCGKGRQPKKPKFQYTQLQLEKPQAL